MSATLAAQPAAQHSSPPTRPQFEHPRRPSSPQPFARILAPPSSSGSDRRNVAAATPASSRSSAEERPQTLAMPPSSSLREKSSPAPPPPRVTNGSAEKDSSQTRIKQERHSPPPVSPTPPSRHRPRRLDLSKDAARVGAPQASAPLTSAGLNAMHDVGIACLSPGFQSSDPAVRQRLERSMDLREQQRQIIEQRQREKDGIVEPALPSSTFARAPPSSRRKGPPPGLSIHAPSAKQFENDLRVIRSAPLGQSFTGLKPGPTHPLSRQVLDRHNPAPPQHQAQAAAETQQSSNRLPPIHDVFQNQGADANDRRPTSQLSRNNSTGRFPAPNRSPGAHAQPGSSPRVQYAPIRSPGYPPPPASASLAPPPRSREFGSADEAVRTLAGGRDELLPKMVHYGGHQPPTPPSPLPSHMRPSEPERRLSAPNPGALGTARRRPREEYERDDASAPVGWEEERARAERSGPFGAGRDSPETQRRKKERFMTLCAEAWDLFHS